MSPIKPEDDKEFIELDPLSVDRHSCYLLRDDGMRRVDPPIESEGNY